MNKYWKLSKNHVSVFYGNIYDIQNYYNIKADKSHNYSRKSKIFNSGT